MMGFIIGTKKQIYILLFAVNDYNQSLYEMWEGEGITLFRLYFLTNNC